MESTNKTPPDRAAAARAIEQFLRALGHEPTGELADTARLVTEAWCDELLAGYDDDPLARLAEATIMTTSDDPVLVRGIDVGMMCPHHLLPSHGRADVLYLPRGKVAGFGALARVVSAHTRRLVLQEDAGRAIARTLVDGLEARGALVRLELVHTCFSLRGAAQPSATIETLALAGTCSGAGADRDLALSMLAGRASAELRPRA
ncbi:MAG: GTP cyclohydrolase I [Deltaproteobacteria bacterium]|nr:GTP cyclohydrolase I [Deltaproteobacteria bacterium]